MTLNRVAIPSPNFSSRGGSKVRLIVIHTSEGATTYRSLGNFFASPSSGVSSHVGTDDTPNTVGEYVQRGNKAWTAANANPVAVQNELCTPSGGYLWTDAQWRSHPNMLANCAQWIKEEAATFGIPIVKLTPAQAQGSSAGVCGHVDLGAWGGGHVDPGQNFPWSYVLSLATGGTPPTPSPGGDENMVLTDPVTGGVWCVDPKSAPSGAVFTYDGAPYLGGTNNTKMNAQNFPCVGIAANPDSKGGGYVLVLDFGSAGSANGGDRYRRYRFPRNGSGKA
jgi:N-acetylmuramoyl-L-alanine amidase